MGVSICLDVVLIESLDLDIVKAWVSMVEKILTASKSKSRQSRYLDQDWEISILSRHQCPDQKVSIEIKKFVEIWKFRHFLTVCLNLVWEVRGFLYFLVEISQSVETLGLDNVEISQQISTASRQISTASWQISKISTCLDKSQQSQRVLTILTKILTRQSQSQKVKSQKSKVDLDRRENLDNLKKLVSTRRTFSISISIGLDCRDPQPYRKPFKHFFKPNKWKWIAQIE